MTNSPNAVAETQRLQTLLDASRLLNSTLELKELTGIILEVVRGEVPVDRVSVFVVDRLQGMLQGLVAQEIPSFEGTLPLGSGIAGTVAVTGEILDIAEAYADPRFDPRFDQFFNYRTNDIFALPVSNRQGETVGVLELLNRLRPITSEDREFLLGISVFIGLALENAYLHSQVVAKERLEEELVELRDRLAQIERLSLMAQLLAGVTHEINNPLTFAMGYAELARTETDTTPKVQGYLKKIELGIDRTAATVRRFQHFVEVQKSVRTSVDLAVSLRQIIELRARDWRLSGIQAVIDIGTVPPVLVHEGQIQLVLMYLIKNAEEAILRSEAEGRIHIRLSSEDQQVRIEIQDTGTGIEPDVQSLVFGPFFTTKPEGAGTGLGLTIAQSIVHQHRGQIRFESGNAGGTKFTVELPA